MRLREQLLCGVSGSRYASLLTLLTFIYCLICSMGRNTLQLLCSVPNSNIWCGSSLHPLCVSTSPCRLYHSRDVSIPQQVLLTRIQPRRGLLRSKRHFGRYKKTNHARRQVQILYAPEVPPVVFYALCIPSTVHGRWCPPFLMVAVPATMRFARMGKTTQLDVGLVPVHSRKGY